MKLIETALDMAIYHFAVMAKEIHIEVIHGGFTMGRIRELYIQLLVKNRLYGELNKFKRQKHLPESERMSNREIYLRNKELLNR